MDHTGNEFQYLCKNLTGMVSTAKLKAGVFNSHQIHMLVNSSAFTKTLNPLEADGWKSFVGVTHNLLGNHCADNYNKIVETYTKLSSSGFTKVLEASFLPFSSGFLSR